MMAAVMMSAECRVQSAEEEQCEVRGAGCVRNSPKSNVQSPKCKILLELGTWNSEEYQNEY